MKVKVKDIAKAAGVSPTAVSLVLNDKPSRLAEGTKERILQVAREMQFQLDGRKTSGSFEGHTKTFGLIVPGEGNPFHEELAREVQRYAARAGYVVFQCNVRNDGEFCAQALESLAVKNVDGLIVTVPADIGKEHRLIKALKALQDDGVPLILLDRAAYSVFCDFVTADNKYGAKMAVEYLIDHGHRRIGCLSGREEVYTARKRMEGYREAMAMRRLPVEENLIVCGDFTIEAGRDGTKALLDQGATAVFAANDTLAWGAYQYAEEQNLTIPGDFSVIGYDNSRLCAGLQPPLTSVDQNIPMMASKAVDLLIQNMLSAEEPHAARNYYFSPVLVERDSVGDR